MILDKSQFQAVLCCSLIGDKDEHIVEQVKASGRMSGT